MSLYTLLDPLVRIAYAAVTGLAAILPGHTGGAAVAMAVVLLTMTVRACLLPVARSALRAERSQAAIAPEIARLRARYANNRQRLAREVAAAYRRAGVSPFAGLRPALIQLPVIGTTYRVLVVPTVAGHPSAIVAAQLFGAPLAAHWPEILTAAGMLSGAGLAFLAVVLALTAVAWMSSRQIRDRARQRGQAGTEALTGADRVTRVLPLLPFGTVLFALTTPLIVSLYLLTTSAWTVGERRILARLA
jgi:YidC/Oxa1 family membrane protein insertase